MVLEASQLRAVLLGRTDDSGLFHGRPIEFVSHMLGIWAIHVRIYM